MTMTKPTSEQVTFLAAGAGATQRTALEKFRDVVSVKDFGAVGDGVADDTAAIQAAITAAANKALYFPAGTYVATALTVSSPCRLFGDGILKKTTAANAAFLTISSSDVVIDGLEFRGASFDATPATMRFLDTAIKVYGASSTSPYRRFNFSNIKINGFAGFAMDIRWSEDVTITGCQIQYCGYAGILFESVVRGVIANNRISWIDSGTATNVYGVSLSRDPTKTATASVPTQEVTVVGNVITDIPKWTGIDTHASLNCEIVGNVVARCKNGMYAQYDSASATYKMPARNTRFDSNIVIGRTTETENEIGIASLGSPSVGARNDNIVIENNIVIGAGNWSGGNAALAMSYSDNSVIRNNTVYKAIGCGIAMVTQCNRCIVENNVINGVYGPTGVKSAVFALIDNNATPSTKCVFANNRLINTTGSDDYKVITGIAYSHAGATDVVFLRNRIDVTNAVKGFSPSDPVRRLIDQIGSGVTPNFYTHLKWELETESCAPFTHTATGGAPREATASQISNFRRLPATGWTTASTIQRVRASYRSTNTTYQIAVRPNEGNAYTAGVYTVDGTNITASTSIPDIYITIEGIYWED